MAYTTIDDPSAYFQVNAYNGASNPQTITNGGNSDLQPDLMWNKRRDSAAPHYIFDSTRGVNSSLSSDDEDAEDTATGYLASFNSDGFTTGSDSALAYSGRTYVAWQWKCNGGTTTSFNESGNNPGGTYQANTTAGFSIVTTTGTGGDGTVSHGLGAVPHWMISKGKSNSGGWVVYHQGNTSAPETDALNLSSNGATVDSDAWYNDTAPTSSVFTLGTTNDINGDTRTYVHYLWTEIQGYSKFGSYTGNGNADGPFIYLGFKPAYFLLKSTDITQHWYVFDTARDTHNPSNSTIQPSTNNAHQTGYAMDFLSNGFKIRHNDGAWNGSGNSYIYMAFAEHPFVSSEGVPTTAR